MPEQQITRSNLPGALKAHAILIGINRYDRIGAHLRTPIADARALQTVLRDHQGFAEKNIHLLTDTTKEDLKEFFAGLRQNNTISSKDALLFYYAGHGLAGDIDGAGAAGYLMPSDTSFSVAQLSENETLLSMEWLFDQLESFDCHHNLAILDCCFAGAFRRISLTRAGMGMGLRPMSKKRFERYQEKRAWQVLTSAGPAEKAADLISERGEFTTNSPFAQALIDALSGNASPDFKPPGKNLGDGILTSHELFLYLHDEVERRTRNATAFKPQNPDLFPMGKHDGGQFIFCDPRHPKNRPDWDQRKRKNPYKGLEQYDLTDSDYYFGRRSDVDRLRTMMQLPPSTSAEEVTGEPVALLISGPSGSGKSSLVKAGLLPAFLENEYEIFQFRPGDRPWSLKQFKNKNWTEVVRAVSEPFRFVAPVQASSARTTTDPPPVFTLDPQRKQVLYIDQAEELFTSCSPAEQTALGRHLQEAMTVATNSRLRIVISMRSDFEWQLELSEFGRHFWEVANHHFAIYRLRKLDLDDLRTVLVHPATLTAYEFEKSRGNDLVDIILQDLNYLSNALPLLSYTMQEMVKQTSVEERLFRISTYRDKVGGVSGALSRRMQAIYDILGAPATEASTSTDETQQQELLRHLFLRMVGLSDGDYVRRRVFRDQQLDELDYAEDHQPTEGILDLLRREDIISTGGEQGIRYEELIHDSLINNWTTGKQWINDFGKEHLSLRRELWKSVVEHTSATSAAALATQAPTDAKTPSLAEEHSSAHYLWDATPKLLQVLKQVTDSALFLLASKEPIDMRQLPEQSESRRAAFTEFWETCCRKREFPDWNSLLLSDHSETLLQLLLRYGKHGLNQAEKDFVAQSWHVRIKAILNLKKERDEARSIALAAKARQLESEDPTVALNLATAACKLHFSEESYSAFARILGKEAHVFYSHKTIIPDRYIYGTGYEASADGQYLIEQILEEEGDECIVRVHDFRGGRLTSFARSFESEVFRIFLRSKGFALVISGVELYLWMLEKDELIPFGSCDAAIDAADISSTGQQIATGHEDGTLRLWRLADQSVLIIPPPVEIGDESSMVYQVIFSPDEEQLLIHYSGGLLRLLNLVNNQDIILQNQEISFAALAFSPDGSIIWMIPEYSSETLFSWDISGQPLELLPGQADSHYHKLIVAPDSQSLVYIDGDEMAYCWNSTKEETWSLSEKVGKVLDAILSPDGLQILTSNDDGTTSLFNLSGEVLKTIPANSTYDTADNKIAFLPDGKHIMTSNEALFKWWNLEDNLRKPLLNISFLGEEKRNTPYHDLLIRGFAFAPQGGKIITVAERGTTSMINVLDFSGEVLNTIKTQERVQYSIAYAPDGKSFLAGSGDISAYLWQTDGELLTTLEGHQGIVTSVAISPDGRLFLTGSADKTVKLWDSDGKVRITLDGHIGDITSVAFSPDQQFVLTGSRDRIAKLWDLSGRELCTFSGHRSAVFSAAFSPDGRFVLTSSADATARRWSLQGELLTTYTGHSATVVSAVFSHDGQLVLTGSKDGTAKLWQLKGELLETIADDSDDFELISVAFSPDDEYLATCSQKQIILRRNFYALLKSPAMWEHKYQLTPEERALYRITWEY